MCLDNTTLPARLVARNHLRPRHHGLIPVHLETCLFLLPLPLLCVAYSCAVVDKKDHSTGAIHTSSMDQPDTWAHTAKRSTDVVALAQSVSLALSWLDVIL